MSGNESATIGNDMPDETETDDIKERSPRCNEPKSSKKSSKDNKY